MCRRRRPPSAAARRAAALAAALLAALLAAPAVAVPVTFRVIAPNSTPAGAALYVAGSFQGWNPGSAAHRLADLGGGLHEITLDLAAGTALEFKFTRGDWARVEKGFAGEELANRAWTVDGPATLQRTVTRWADLAPGNTRAGDVTTHTVPGFLGGRRVWVCLPPGYAVDTARSYPVLYMLDGQNVFDLGTSFAGEWMADEAARALTTAGLSAPAIIVAVDNGGAARLNEYTPWYDPGYGAGGGADAHLQAFADVLVPWVNAGYRSLTGPAHTALAGSSLGGLLAVYATYARPDVFGSAAALSPSIWWSNGALLDYVASRPRLPATIYVDMGTRESGAFRDTDGNGVDDSIDDLRALRDVLLGQGFTAGADLRVVEDPGATHSEWHWAQRFAGALGFLFPAAVSAAPAPPAAAAPRLLPAAPNPFNPRTVLAFKLPAGGQARLDIYDLAGRRVRALVRGALPAGPHAAAWDGRDDRGRAAPAGVYVVELRAGAARATGRVTLAK